MRRKVATKTLSVFHSIILEVTELVVWVAAKENSSFEPWRRSMVFGWARFKIRTRAAGRVQDARRIQGARKNKFVNSSRAKTQQNDRVVGSRMIWLQRGAHGWGARRRWSGRAADGNPLCARSRSSHSGYDIASKRGKGQIKEKDSFETECHSDFFDDFLSSRLDKKHVEGGFLATW